MKGAYNVAATLQILSYVLQVKLTRSCFVQLATSPAPPRFRPAKWGGNIQHAQKEGSGGPASAPHPHSAVTSASCLSTPFTCSHRAA